MGRMLDELGIAWSTWEFDDAKTALWYVIQWKAGCAYTHLRNEWSWHIGAQLPRMVILRHNETLGTHEERPATRAYLYAIRYPNGTLDISFLCVKHSVPVGVCLASSYMATYMD